MRATIILLVGWVLYMALVVSCQLGTEPESYFRVGFLTPDSSLVFYAEVEPKEPIHWLLEWETGSWEGHELQAGIIAVRPNAMDLPMKFKAWTDTQADSVLWGGE